MTRSEKKKADRKPSKDRPSRSRPVRALIFFGRIPIYFFLFLLVLLVLIHALFQIPAFTSKVLDIALPKVNALINTDIRVGYFSLSLLPLKVELRDAVFTGAGDTHRMPFAGAKRIRARLSLPSMLVGEIHVTEVHIDGGWNYLLLGDGVENAPDFPSKKKKKKPDEGPKDVKFPLIVDRAYLNGAAFYLDYPSLEMYIAADEINSMCFCDMMIERQASTDLVISSGSFRLGERIAQQIDELAVKGSFSFRDFAVDAQAVKLKTPELDLTASGKLWDLKTELAMAIRTEFAADAKAVNRMFLEEPKLTGKVLAEVNLDAKLPDLGLKGTVRMDQGKVNDLDIAGMDLDFHMNLDRLVLDSLDLQAAGGTLHTVGTFAFKPTGLVAKSRIRGVDIRQALLGYGIKDVGVSGRAGGEMSAAIDFEEETSVSAKVDLSIKNAAYRNASGEPMVGTDAVSIKGDLVLKGKRIRVDRVKVSTPHTDMEGDFEMDPSGRIKTWYRVVSSDLSDFSPLLSRPLSGEMTLAGRGSGPSSDLDNQGFMRLKDVRWGEIAMDYLESDYRQRAAKLSFEGMNLWSGKTHLVLAGWMDLGAGPDLDLRLEAKQGNLRELWKIAGQDLDITGKFDLDAALQGPYDRMNGRIDLDIGKGKAYGEKFSGLDALLEVGDGRFDIERLLLTKDGARLSIDGSFDPFRDKIAVQLFSEGFDTGHINRLGKENPLKAAIGIQAKLEGELTNPNVDGRIEIEDIALEEGALGNLALDFGIKDRALRADLEGLEGQIRAAADLRLEGDLPVSATYELREVDLSILEVLVPRLAGARGRMLAQGSLTGPLAASEKLTADLAVEKFRFIKGEMDLANQEPFRLVYADDWIRTDGMDLQGKGTRLSVFGVEERGERMLILESEMDLALLAEFMESIAESKGTFGLEIQLYGSLSHPEYMGLLSVNRGALDVINFPQPFQDIDVSATLTGETFYLEGLSAKTGGGTIASAGEIAMDGLSPVEYDFFFRAKGVKTGYDPYLEAVLEKADLLLEGREGVFELAGDVYLDRAVYSQNIDWRTILEAFKKKPSGAVETFEEEEEEYLIFNVAVHADDGLLFQNNLADIEMASEVIVTGSNLELGMLGSVEVLEGWAKVIKSEYELTSGLIQFFDETRIYPFFDINAETTVKEVFITVNVSGNPDRWQWAFNSEPPKSEQDIVALLSLGIDYEEFQRLGTGSDATAEDAAISAAAKVVGSQIGGLAGQYVDLDIGVDTSTSIPRLRVGRELQKDLYFVYFWEIMESGIAAQMEYNFFKFMSLLATWRNERGGEENSALGAFGGGIKFRIEFQ